MFRTLFAKLAGTFLVLGLLLSGVLALVLNRLHEPPASALAWLVVGNLVLMLLAAAAATLLVARPIRRLRRAMESFDASGLKAEPRGHTQSPGMPDEVDRLAERFRAMTVRVTSRVASLERSDEVRKQRLADIAHDLKTPLTAMQGCLDTVVRGNGKLSEADRSRYLQMLQKHARQMSALVEEILELAALEAPEMRLKPEPFPVDELVHDILDDLRFDIESRALSVDVRAGSVLPRIEADIALAERALKNVVENAVRLSPRGGVVEIQIGQDDTGNAEITVADRGPGIPSGEAELIFSRFYSRAPDDPRARRGLGLAITRKIVELHGGSVACANRPQGGASFRLVFPPRPKSGASTG